MAITKQQQPTTPNQANGDLLYVLTSTNTNRPQFQYVMEVSDGTTTSTIKQQPNPSGKGVFNIGQIVRDMVSIDEVWRTAEYATSPLSATTINTVFYEETGSSISASVGYSSGTSGSSVYVLNGVNYYDSWNFPSCSYYTSSIASQPDTFTLQHTLTNAPLTQSIRDGEYATISFINGNFNGSSTKAQDILYTQFTWYDSSGALLQYDETWNTVAAGGGPRINQLDLWDVAVATQTDATRLIHIGVGHQNLIDNGVVPPSGWASYSLVVTGQGDDGQENNGAEYANLYFTKSNGRCGYDGTRFAFLNELGVWDYYTFPLASSKRDAIERNSYEQSFVDYSTSTDTITYDTARRGTNIYSIKYDEARSAESDYLSQADADWLRELVESPSVYIQDGTIFRPIVISNVDYQYKINPRADKMYRLSIQYKVAVQRFGR